MSEMPVSILSDGVGKPFSVRPAADDDLKYKYIFINVYIMAHIVPSMYAMQYF